MFSTDQKSSHWNRRKLLQVEVGSLGLVGTAAVCQRSQPAVVKPIRVPPLTPAQGNAITPLQMVNGAGI